MNPLDDAATALAELLTEATGWTVYPSVPGRMAMPLGVVYPGDPYLTDGQTFGSLTIHLDVRLIAQTGAAEAVASDINGVLADALVALINGGYSVDDIRTGSVTIANGQFLVADFTTSISIRL